MAKKDVFSPIRCFGRMAECFGRSSSAEIDRSFGRSFGFGRTLSHTFISNLPKFHAWCHKFGKLAQKVLDIWQHVLYFMSLAWTHKVSYNVQQKLYECPFMNNSTQIHFGCNSGNNKEKEKHKELQLSNIGTIGK